MKKAELSARVATKTTLSKAGDDDAVTAAFSTIADPLASHKTVRITGFGIFSTRSRPARQGRNPHRGLEHAFLQAWQDPSRRRQLAAEVETYFVAPVRCWSERSLDPQALLSGTGAIVRFIPERRCREICDSSLVRADAQSCTQLESLRARVPYMARGEFSPATAMRADALQSKFTRSLAAYVPKQFTAEPLPERKQGYRTHDHHLPTVR